MTLYEDVCSYDNLLCAFEKAKKGKCSKLYVINFEKNLNQNLLNLRNELVFKKYKPKPLKTFILHDPKTRKISKSDFRDRIVHHAICNIIEQIFEKRFIYDSYANRIGKGTFKAIERFDCFKRKVSKNNIRTCYILKAGIKHYFETVVHQILMSLIKRHINDEDLLSLVQIVLSNYSDNVKCKGMPLGNLTSQFFANIYLHELDFFVKQHLRVKYYIRYVDDFVILHHSKKVLSECKIKIEEFLRSNLDLELHPDKTKIVRLENGANFLGFRVFFNHKLVRKKNMKKFERKFNEMKKLYKNGNIDREKIVEKFEGWLAYIQHANTYKYRRHLVRQFNKYFPLDKKEIINIKKNQNIHQKIEESNAQFSYFKTLQLMNKGVSIKNIAECRGLKEATVWVHIAKLIELNKLSVWKILCKERIKKILIHIKSDTDKVKEIKERVKYDKITYSEINCVLACIKSQNRNKNVVYHVSWYCKNHCYRKCYFNKRQRMGCKNKFDIFLRKNPNLEMARNEFVSLFNDGMTICVLPDSDKRRFVSWKEFKTKLNLYANNKKKKMSQQ